MASAEREPGRPPDAPTQVRYPVTALGRIADSRCWPKRGLAQGRALGYDARMEIRTYQDSDWPAVWAIIQHVVAAGETYAYDPAWTAEQMRGVWIEAPPGHTVVASEGQRLLGTAKMGPNRPGPGAHVATASFMVADDARGHGIGRALGEYALAWARANGYAAMQFNAVVESNTAAVHLWQALGFRIIGTVPQAFAHPTLGRVGLHIMHRYL